jgi:hypothetical protein
LGNFRGTLGYVNHLADFTKISHYRIDPSVLFRLHLDIKRSPAVAMASKVADFRDKLEKTLSEEGRPWTPLLGKAEEKTGVKRLYIVLGMQLHLTKSLSAPSAKM